MSGPTTITTINASITHNSGGVSFKASSHRGAVSLFGALVVIAQTFPVWVRRLCTRVERHFGYSVDRRRIVLRQDWLIVV